MCTGNFLSRKRSSSAFHPAANANRTVGCPAAFKLSQWVKSADYEDSDYATNLTARNRLMISVHLDNSVFYLIYVCKELGPLVYCSIQTVTVQKYFEFG
jgi:hypothetical protein